MIANLRSGKIRVDDIPAIRVVEKNGNLITLDNRRLVAFQNAKIESIQIEKVSLSEPTIYAEFRRKYNPIYNGDLVVIIEQSIFRDAEELFLRSNGKIK